MCPPGSVRRGGTRLTTLTPGRHPPARRFTTAPRWPSLQLAAFTLLATVSLAQGIVDLVIPVLMGEPPFTMLMTWTERLGPAFLATYVFLHNIGLACVVPGYGFLAARFERKTENRGLIGILLVGAVVLSLLVALQYLVMARERFDLLFAIPLYVVEAVAILLLALPAARELRGFVPTPRYDWSLLQPFRKLHRPFMTSFVILAVLAAAEAAVLMA